MKILEIITEVAKVELSHDPNYFGATVSDKGTPEKTVLLPINRLTGFEPESKMNHPDNAKNLKKIINALHHGAAIPPILVRKISPLEYQIVDGHHRFFAYKKLGIKKIPSRIVSKVNIKDD